MKWFLSRASEGSSWAGLGVAVNALYMALYSGVDPLTAAGLGLPALFAFVKGDKDKGDS